MGDSAVTNLVGNDAVGHVHYRRSELGPLSGDEVLFEIIALDPGTAEDEVPVKDSIATTLLRRFALPEAPMPEQKVTKESAEHLLRSRIMA